MSSGTGNIDAPIPNVIPKSICTMAPLCSSNNRLSKCRSPKPRMYPKALLTPRVLANSVRRVKNASGPGEGWDGEGWVGVGGVGRVWLSWVVILGLG